ncbi:MAG: phosphodiester glycosidase family protein [Verrucomicrobiota bacterium]
MDFNKLIGGLVLSCCGVVVSGAEISAPDHPLPGIVLYSETRTNPPQHLFIAEIDLTHPKVQLHVSPGGPDPDGAGPWETTLMRPTKIAVREKYDLVVNGDFFSARGVKDAEGTNSAFRAEIWSSVVGPAVSGGKVWSTTTNARPCLVVSKTGKVSIQRISQPQAEDWEVVSGNVMLVREGKAVPHETKVRHPRTVVGLNKEATKMILLVVDGRKPGVALGMNYDELAAELLRLGCYTALNLDGGGSSVLAVRDPAKNEFKILNAPTDGRERAVANVLGISVDASTGR